MLAMAEDTSLSASEQKALNRFVEHADFYGRVGAVLLEMQARYDIERKSHFLHRIAHHIINIAPGKDANYFLTSGLAGRCGTYLRELEYAAHQLRLDKREFGIPSGRGTNLLSLYEDANAMDIAKMLLAAAANPKRDIFRDPLLQAEANHLLEGEKLHLFDMRAAYLFQKYRNEWLDRHAEEKREVKASLGKAEPLRGLPIGEEMEGDNPAPATTSEAAPSAVERLDREGGKHRER